MRGTGADLETEDSITMDSPTLISVLICTYNRAHSLMKTLESVTAQSLPQGVDLEILVVDNNSNDGTRQVAENFRRQFQGRFRYVLEECQGISYARNTGIRESKGEILAFIDDDEIAAPVWLQNITSNLYSGDWAGAGGPVVSQWNWQPPAWWSDHSPFTLGPLAAWASDPQVRLLAQPPVGANMAYRREAFDRFGVFRTDLGRVGKVLLHGEDTEFGRRLMAAGLRLCYEPSAITFHPVDKSRVSRKYFLDWWFNKGKSDIREFADLFQMKRLFPILLRLFRDAAVEAARWVITFDPARRFICVLKIWAYAGQAFEYYRQSSDAKKKGPLLNSDARP
jgi:glycosyltransferase involved in cell wall biosynthesis